MNTHLKEALIRQTVKRKIRKRISLSKTQTQKEKIEEATLYKAFVEPFTDVLQAANLAGQDFLNSSLTFLRMFITFDREKAKELLKKHDERKAKIAEKWKPLMERTDAALNTGDADIIALTLAPQVWAVSAVGTAAANYGGSMGTFLNDVGLGSLAKLALPGLALRSIEVDTEEDKKTPLIDKISVLFLGVVGAKSFMNTLKKSAGKKNQTESRNLFEQDQKPDFKKDFERFIKDTGADKKFEKDADELFDSLKQTIKDFDDDYEAKKEMIEKLIAASNLQEFEEALEVEEQDESQSISQMKNELKNSVDKLVKSNDFLEQVKDESNKDDPTEDEIRKAAEKVVFLEAKQNMEEDLGGFQSSLDEYTKEVGEVIKEILPTDVGLGLLKKSKSSKASEVINFVEKAKQKYSIT